MGASASMTMPDRPDGAGEVQARMAERLAQIAQARDAAAFAELFDHFGPRVKAFMMRGGAAADIAEDLAQETMLTVWRKADLYVAERGLVSTWIFRIARNLRVDRLRRRGPHYFVELDEACDQAAPPVAETDVARSEERVAVALALKELPAEQCEIVKLAFLQGLTQAEIASRLALPLGTVKSRLRLAYGKLRASLDAFR
jgi:RNA polymerase sigma-70 factor (ECF subfamily)